jgi:hypothetical protein
MTCCCPSLSFADLSWDFGGVDVAPETGCYRCFLLDPLLVQLLSSNLAGQGRRRCEQSKRLLT